MRYGFINNFAQALSGELAQGATSMTLDDNGALLDNASAEMVYTLTLFDVTSGENEIVYVTAADGNELTVERGQEGTTDRAWPTGTQVEMRLTAGAMGALHSVLSRGVAEESIQVGSTKPAEGFGSIAIGLDAEVKDWASVAVGQGSAAPGYACVAYGPYSESGTEEWAEGSVALGWTAAAAANSSTAVGAYAKTEGEFAVSVGAYGEASSDNSIAVGRSAKATGEGSVAVGQMADAKPTSSVALGVEASVADGADYGLALGRLAKADVVGGFRVNALSYLGKTGLFAWQAGDQPTATRQTAQQVVLGTEALDLTDSGDSYTLDLPGNTLFFVDAIDIVIVEADGAGGDPEIIIGPDDQDPDAYLAATPVTKTTAGGRETHDPLMSDGVTSLRVAVDTAGTGTYKAKVVFRGYVMEV